MIYRGRQRRQEFASAAKGRRPAFEGSTLICLRLARAGLLAISSKTNVERFFEPKDSNSTKKLCPVHSLGGSSGRKKPAINQPELAR